MKKYIYVLMITIVAMTMAGCEIEDFDSDSARSVQVMTGYTKSKLRINGFTYTAILPHPRAVETEVETTLGDAAIGEIESCNLSEEEMVVNEREDSQNLYRLVRSRIDVRLQGVPKEIPVYFLQEKAYLRTRQLTYEFLTPKQQIAAEVEAKELPFTVIGGRMYLRSKVLVRVQISPEGKIKPVVSTTSFVAEIPTNVEIEKPEEIVDTIVFFF